MATEAIENEQVELGFLLEWILVCTIIWIVITFLGFSLDYLGSMRHLQDYGMVVNGPDYFKQSLMVFVYGVIGGVIGGIAQWIVLQLRLPP